MKYLRAIKHLSPNRFVFVTLVAFFLLYIFIFLDTGNKLCINSPLRGISSRYSSRKLPSFVPIADDHPNVVSTFVVYTFGGTVESASSNRLRIVSRGGYLPEFNIDSFTPIFWGENQKAKPATVSDLKAGAEVMILANYYGSATGWKVNRITIL